MKLRSLAAFHKGAQLLLSHTVRVTVGLVGVSYVDLPSALSEEVAHLFTREGHVFVALKKFLSVEAVTL